MIPNTACIIVGTNGFVWYAPKVTDHGEYIMLENARTIRKWGTTNGLAQLVTGPTKETALDASASIVLAKSAFLFAIPCNTWNV